jgi:hypothetical protein
LERSGGYLAEQLSPRSPTAVAWLPAVGLGLAIPLYIVGFYMEPGTMQIVIWGLGAACHYSYLGAQYTIGQGVVSQRSRASAIAILLFIIALIGNGLGPQIVGILSDMFMKMQIDAAGMGDTLTTTVCRGPRPVGSAGRQQAVCATRMAKACASRWRRRSCSSFPQGPSIFWPRSTLKKDMVAKPV